MLVYKRFFVHLRIGNSIFGVVRVFVNIKNYIAFIGFSYYVVDSRTVNRQMHFLVKHLQF